jgi:hypothetical protein
MESVNSYLEVNYMEPNSFKLYAFMWSAFTQNENTDVRTGT